MRNSSEPEVMLVFSRAAWEAFATGMRNGEFETATPPEFLDADCGDTSAC